MNTIAKDARGSLGWVLVAGFVGIAATASLMTPAQRADVTISDLPSREPVESVLTERGYRAATIASSQRTDALSAVEPPDAEDVPSSVMLRRAKRPPTVVSYVPGEETGQIARHGRRR